MPPTLPDRLRAGDATALLALGLRRADAPAAAAEAWALGEVVAYCAAHAPRRSPRHRTFGERWSAALRTIARACAHLGGPSPRLGRSTTGG